MINEHPKGWERIRLVELVTSRKGKKPAVTKGGPTKGFVPYLDIESIEKGTDRKYAEVASSRLATEKDVLIVWDGARSGWAGQGRPGAIGSTLMALEPLTCDRDYLYRFLQSHFDQVNTNTRGTGIPHVDPEVFWNIEVPVAPLNEQRWIVAKLEKLLGKVDASQQRLAKIPNILKRFRQSVLAAVCSGRLTADWRQERGIELEAWTEAVLKDVAEMRLGKMLDNAKNIGNPTRYLRNLNVRWFSFDLSNVGTMRATSEERNELEIKDGDLLVCEGGEPGRCGVWNFGVSDLIFQKAIHRIRGKEMLNPYWLAFNIRNDANSAHLEDYFTGTTINHLTGKALATYRFPLPSVSEQSEIVRRVEALFALADQIEARFAKAKARVDQITQSLLAKAFRGELVPQNPNDEPASVLLELIKAERAGNDSRTKKRK